MSKTRENSQTNPEQVEPIEAESRGSKAKAVFLLTLSLMVFLAVAVLCVSLIHRSSQLEPLPTQETVISPLEYMVNEIPTQTVTQGEEEETPIDLKAPESQYKSSMINILLLGVEEDKNDTLILCSIHLGKRNLSLLSIPRDTYIAGDYDIPKINSVYGAYQPQKRVAAVMDTVKGMLGFAPDYYFLLDEATLSKMAELAGTISFAVPQEPAYHSLKEGTKELTKDNVFELFRFKESWKDVETEPTKVQRDFLIELFAALLADKSSIAEKVIAISEVAQTDLSMEELAYLAYLLADFDFDEAFTRPLPGAENKIGKGTYFQVSPSKAVELLNEHHNPLKKELSIYNVNFRQEQKGSGEGEFSDYGNFGTTAPSTGKKPTSSTKPTEDPTGSDATEGTDPTESSDPSESGDSTAPTDPTEGGDSTEPTENQPTEEPQPTGGTETPTPGSTGDATEPTQPSSQASTPTESSPAADPSSAAQP